MNEILVGFEPGRVGRMYSKQLFKQFQEADGPEPIYDLDEFHKTFIKEEDLTEYRPALKLCGTWKEWLRLKRDWHGFNNYIAEWKAELELKLKSDAMQKIIKVAKESDETKAVNAAKWIAEAGYDKNERGRPSERQKRQEAKEIAKAAAETAAEEKRIFTLLAGGKQAVNEE